MDRRPVATLALASVAGLGNVAVVLALYARADYPILGSSIDVAPLVVTGFVVGFVPLLVSAYTRLLAPAVGFVAVLAGTVYLELTSPSPEWSELGGYVVVDGPTHVGSYANTWYVWLALLLLAGAVEFAIRRGYGIGNRRLRNLPDLPIPRPVLAWTVAGFAALVGVATTLLVIRSGIEPSPVALVVFAVTSGVVAVPLAALLARGLLLPIVLFAALVPYFVTVEVFATTDSPVHILLFGPYAVVIAAAWLLEEAVRSRLWGWDGGRFARREGGE